MPAQPASRGTEPRAPGAEQRIPHDVRSQPRAVRTRASTGAEQPGSGGVHQWPGPVTLMRACPFPEPATDQGREAVDG